MLMAFCAASAMRFPSVRIKRIQAFGLEDIEGARVVLREEREVFIQSFSHSYSGYPEGTLKLPAITDLRRFLSDAFAEDEAAFFRASTYRLDDAHSPHRFYKAVVNDGSGEKSGGYLSIDVLDGGRESYLRQLAVLPEYQKAGIASALVQHSIDDLPEVQKVTVSYRKTNSAAESFYRKFGFMDADECHSTLSAEVYNGMVLHK